MKEGWLTKNSALFQVCIDTLHGRFNPVGFSFHRIKDILCYKTHHFICTKMKLVDRSAFVCFIYLMLV